MTLSPNPMGEFFERIGHRTICTDSSWWYEVQPGVLLSFPYYKLLNPPREEIDELIGKYRLKALRYPTPVDCFGFPSVLEVNTDQGYSIEKLDREARRETRRGLENCKLEQIDFDYLHEHGMQLNCDTASRQKREMIYTNPEYWKRYCQAGKATSGVTALGVFVDGQLGTYLVSAEFDGWWNWLLTNSSTALLKKRPSNVLFYEGTKRFFENNPDKKICYGLGSLESVDNLDYFKLNMGVTMQPIKQRLVFSNKYHMIFNNTPEFALKLLRRLFPKNYTVRKATSMIELYRQQTKEVKGA